MKCASYPNLALFTLLALMNAFLMFNAIIDNPEDMSSGLSMMSSVLACHGRTGRKKLGGRKEICPTLSECARVVKKNFPEKLSKIVVGRGGRSDYGKFLLDSIFPTKLTEFLTKLTEFVPFIFIISQYCPTVKRILPDWLCLPNKLGGAAAPLAPPPARYAHAYENPSNKHAHICLYWRAYENPSHKHAHICWY